jgi:hypothetical protein
MRRSAAEDRGETPSSPFGANLLRSTIVTLDFELSEDGE